MTRSESKYFNTAKKMDLALVELLKTKPLEYVTVSEICQKAGVNRSTFYLHYETVMDLLNETARLLLDDFLTYFNPDSKAIAFDLAEADSEDLFFICDEYLLPYLTYIKDHKEVFSTAVRHIKTFGFEEVYERMFTHIFDPILDRFHYSVDQRKYVMKYYLSGICAIVMEWIRDGCEKKAEEISAIITICIYGKDGNFRPQK